MLAEKNIYLKQIDSIWENTEVVDLLRYRAKK